MTEQRTYVNLVKEVLAVLDLVQEFSSASLNFELFGLNTFENNKITLHRYI